jgi:photosystem II stability/assembly factor-like uncharacterized protein
MKQITLTTFAFIGFLTIFFVYQTDGNTTLNTNQKKEDKLYPNDIWYQQRAYPNGFSEALYLKRLNEVKLQAKQTSIKTADLNLSWQLEGPGNIGGRFNVLKQDPINSNIIYAGAANGGIFKTTDGGNTWSPIFDDLAFLSIGAIEINPNNSNTIYVGTGDRNFGGHSHIGNGMYKSIDGGNTWNHLGLAQTGIVTKVIINPSDTNMLYASTLGNTFEKTTERGVYKSIDGGMSWNQILFISDSSGVADMVMDPTNSDVIYASGYNRLNNFSAHRVSGPAAKVFKTIDGGLNWSILNGGLPTTNESRVGLEIDQNNPNTVYAIYIGESNLDIKDIYKSTDGGNNWLPMTIHSNGVPTDMMGNFGWYFGELFVNPYNSNHIMIGGVDMFQTLDGGLSWNQNVPDWWTYDVHADKHDVLFIDSTTFIIATDGGLYKTTDNGQNWTDIENIPVTQFYHIEVDPHSDNYAGGAQDNGTSYGNSLSLNFWQKHYGGDGFRVTYLQNSPGDKIYETQNGGIVYEDATSNTTNISPNVVSPDRTNWDTPYFINENTGEFFVGTSKIMLMQNVPNGSYTDISSDLTKVGIGQPNGLDRYHTISEIEGVNNNEDMIFVGTNDGLVWRGDRISGNWIFTNVTGNLPNRYVTEIKSSTNTNTIYVSFSGYDENDYTPHLFKTNDFGNTWESIAGDLPQMPVNDISIINGFTDDAYLFAALDGGVYFTSNGGVNWFYLGVDIPLVTVSDIEIDYANQKLIAGTFSRSMYSYDISSILSLVNINENAPLNLSVYPNPANHQIHITTQSKGGFNLYNANGQLVLSESITSKNTTISISNLKNGVYFYQFNTAKGTIIKK